jgi:hypothetical protein
MGDDQECCEAVLIEHFKDANGELEVEGGQSTAT